MRIARDPGEQIEVDWAGDTMTFIDPVTGERLSAYLFVAALSFSAYAYVEAFADMTQIAALTACPPRKPQQDEGNEQAEERRVGPTRQSPHGHAGAMRTRVSSTRSAAGGVPMPPRLTALALPCLSR